MKKSNLEAIKLLIIPFVCLILGGLLVTQGLLGFLSGTVFLTIFFFQSFILLHECGHNSLFKTSILNDIFGNFFSVFVFIPYYNWKHIHYLHHIWTGYRDKDPTTEKTFESNLSPMKIKLADFCWKYSIPIFTLGYRIGIYWKVEKLRRHLSQKDARFCIISMIFYILFYVLVFTFFTSYIVLLLPSVFLSCIFTDLLSMSQHSHILMEHSNGEDIEPMKYAKQAKYSRSLIFNETLSRYFLFNMNYHIEHHAYPGLPCYFLPKIKTSEGVRKDLVSWVKKVKSIPGSDFVFKTGIHDV